MISLYDMVVQAAEKLAGKSESDIDWYRTTFDGKLLKGTIRFVDGSDPIEFEVDRPPVVVPPSGGSVH